jgi:hypothetical protein
MTDRDKPLFPRRADGKFAPGGNAGPGREWYRVEYRKAMREAVSEERLGRIMAKQAEKAEQGDTQAAKFVTDRILGKVREAPPTLSLELGDIRDPEQVREAMDNVVRLVAAGRLEAKDGQVLVNMFTRCLEVGTVNDLLENLENAEIPQPKPWRPG